VQDQQNKGNTLEEVQRVRGGDLDRSRWPNSQLQTVVVVAVAVGQAKSRQRVHGQVGENNFARGCRRKLQARRKPTRKIYY